MQIERYELTLEIDDADRKLFHSPARGALMHGLLMRAVASDDIHSQSNAPRLFSQYLSGGNDTQRIWTINLLHEKAAPIKQWLHNLKSEVEENGPSSGSTHLYLEHYDCAVKVNNVVLSRQLSYQDLFSETMNELPPKFSTFNLLTPTIFKRAGQEQPHPYPEARLMVQSALSRWNAFSDCAKFEEPEILDDIARHVSVFSFKLNSQHVAMDKIDFAGSTGSLSFIVKKSEIRQIMDLCGRYAEFCGLGAKTAMGLGAVKYTAQELQRNSP